VRVVASELLAPIGLEDDLPFHLVRPQPQQGDEQAGESVGSVQALGEEEPAQAGAGITKGQLIAREALTTEVSVEQRAQALLVQNVLEVHLEEEQGALLFPGPMGWIEGTAALGTGTSEVMPIQDMTDGMGGEGDALSSEVKSQAARAVPRLLPRLYHLFFHLWGRVTGHVVGPTGAVSQPCLPFLLVSFQPFPHYLAGGMPLPCRGPDASCLLVRADQALSCFNGVHGVYFPVGQVSP